MGNKIFHQRNVFQHFVYPLMNYIMFYALFSGTKAFAFFEWLYIFFFDYLVRRKLAPGINDDINPMDYENPKVTGRLFHGNLSMKRVKHYHIGI